MDRGSVHTGSRAVAVVRRAVAAVDRAAVELLESTDTDVLACTITNKDQLVRRMERRLERDSRR